MRAERGEIPSGYTWKDLPGVGASFPMPDTWFFLHQQVQGSHAFFMTRESIPQRGIFSTGVTVNYIPDLAKLGQGKAEDFPRHMMSTLPVLQPVSNMVQAEDGPLVSCRRRFVLPTEQFHPVPSYHGGVELKRIPPSHYYYLAVANRDTGGVHIAYFETPSVKWRDDRSIAETMIEKAVFDKSVTRKPVEELDPLTALIANLPKMEEIRRKIGKINFEDPQAAGESLTTATEGLYKEWMTRNSQSFTEDVQEAIKAQTSLGLPKTPPIAISGYLYPLTSMMAKAAVRLIAQGGDLVYAGATQLDFEKGFRNELGAVANAHINRRPPTTEEEFLARHDKRLGINMVDAARAERVAQEPRAQLAKLIKDDPTGFSVLRWQIEQFEAARDSNDRGRFIRSYETPEVVIAGAKFAQSKYHDLYQRIATILEK